MRQKFKNLLYNKAEMSDGEYKRARKGFIIDAVCDNGAANITSGAYFAGLLAYLHVSEAASSFIISLGVIASIFQLLTPYITQNKHKKPFVLFCKLLTRSLMGIVFLLPFITKVSTTSVILTAILFFASSAFASMVTPAYNIWLMDCAAHKNSAGKYFGIKDGISSLSTVAAFLAAGYITREFCGEREIYSYLWLGIICLVLFAILMVTIFFVKEPPVKIQNEKVQLLSVAKDMFVSKKVRKYIVYYSLYCCGFYMANAITSVFFVQRLNMGMEFLSYRVVLDLLLRTGLSPLMGKLADKKGMKRVLQISLVFMGLCHLLYAFTNKQNAVPLLIITTIISAIWWAGFGLSNFNYLFESTPEKNRSAYIACTSTFCQAIGYASSLFATFFLLFAKGFSVNIFSLHFDEMNILFIIVTGLIVASCLSLGRQKKLSDADEV